MPAPHLRLRAFTLIELLVTVAIVATLIAITVPAVQSAMRHADRTKSTAQIRKFGTGIFSFATEHNGLLPGPLWPGQVAEYDPNRNGRLVVELAPYLGIEQRTTPYVPTNLLTRSLIAATPGVDQKNIRLYVMNMAVNSPNGAINPWGSAASPTPGSPRSLASINPLPLEPLLTEAWQEHPAVTVAPWKSSTPPNPPHGKQALSLLFDGSVRPEIP
jgi:prepilin-type N-terminal cleavage/methylation domain-containing protein